MRINLLPPTERVSRSQMSALFVMLSLLYFFCFCSVYGYFYFQRSQLESKLADVRRQYELLRPTELKMRSIKEKERILSARTNILAALTKERIPWHAAIARFGVITPRAVWLTELTTTEQNRLRVQGRAKSYPDLAAYLQQVQEDPTFLEPMLIKAEQDASSATKFEISLKLKGM